MRYAPATAMASPRKNWPTPPVFPPAPLVLILAAIIGVPVRSRSTELTGRWLASCFLIIGPGLPSGWGRIQAKERAGATSMKRALSVVLFLIVGLGAAPPPAPAFQAAAARYYDVQRLEDDLAVLDDSLVALPTSHPRYQEFADRADALRQELVRLRDDMDRGGRANPD